MFLKEYIRPDNEVVPLNFKIILLLRKRKTEVDRLDMMHHIFKVMKDGKLFEAPVSTTVQRVLDVGCVGVQIRLVTGRHNLTFSREQDCGLWSLVSKGL
jgi:hypothetical protein